MRIAKCLAAFLCLAVITGCAGYPVKEQKARDMLNRALLLQNDGESESADKLLTDIRDNYADTSAATDAIRMLTGVGPKGPGQAPCDTSDCIDSILETAAKRAEEDGTYESARDILTLAVLLGKYAGDGEMPDLPGSLGDDGEDEDEGGAWGMREVKPREDPALSTVKNAYMAAMAFFLDKPGSVAALPDLGEYGFEVPPGVTFNIADGHEKSFSVSAFSEKGDKVYSVDAEGGISEVARPGMEAPAKGDEGASEEPVRTGKFDSEAESEIKGAYVAAQIFFLENPKKEASLEGLKKYGFKQSAGVTVLVEDGGEDSLSIKTWHEKGSIVFSIDAAGEIKRAPRK